MEKESLRVRRKRKSLKQLVIPDHGLDEALPTARRQRNSRSLSLSADEAFFDYGKNDFFTRRSTLLKAPPYLDSIITPRGSVPKSSLAPRMSIASKLDVLNSATLSPEAKVESLYKTLKLMGAFDKKAKLSSPIRRRSSVFSMYKSSAARARMQSENLDELTVLLRNDGERKSPSRTLGASTARSSSPTAFSQTASTVGGWDRVRRRRHTFKGKSKPFIRWRLLCNFLTVLFRVWKTHASKVSEFLAEKVNTVDVNIEVDDVLFDSKDYRADNKHPRVPKEVVRILMKKPGTRSPEEVHYVALALRMYDSLQGLPLRIHNLIAERSWYESYDAKRIVIRQGHVARCFYFILSGGVIVTRMEPHSTVSKTVKYLIPGDSFGDRGLLNNSARTATCLTDSTVELFVISDEDYMTIFHSGGLKDTSDSLFRKVKFLRQWPYDLLPKNTPLKTVMSFFKKGSTIVEDSTKNPWLYIVKSGNVSVFRKIERIKEKKKEKKENSRPKKNALEELTNSAHDRYLEGVIMEQDSSRNIARQVHRRNSRSQISVPLAEELYKFTSQKEFYPELDDDLVLHLQEIHRKAIREDEHDSTAPGGECAGQHLKAHPPGVPSTVPEGSESRTPHTGFGDGSMIQTPSRPSRMPSTAHGKAHFADMRFSTFFEDIEGEDDDDDDEEEEEPEYEYVRIQTLRRGDIFGLTELVHEDHQPQLSLVSDGAECLLIDKKFYMDNVGPQLMTTILTEVRPYPTDSEIKEHLETEAKWSKHKKDSVKEALGYVNTEKQLRKDKLKPMEMRKP